MRESETISGNVYPQVRSGGGQHADGDAERVVLKEWARPYLIAPLRITRTDTTWNGRPPTGTPPGSWVISGHIMDGQGRVIGQNGTLGTNMNIAFEPKGIDSPEWADAPTSNRRTTGRTSLRSSRDA